MQSFRLENLEFLFVIFSALVCCDIFCPNLCRCNVGNQKLGSEFTFVFLLFDKYAKGRPVQISVVKNMLLV